MPAFTFGSSAIRAPFGGGLTPDRRSSLWRNLVLAYPIFNDRRTDIIHDYGPYKQNGTMSSSKPVKAPAPGIGEAYKLVRASSQGIQVGGNSRLNSLAPLSISLWINPTSWENSGGARSIVEKLSASGHGFYYLLRQINSGNLEIDIDYSTTFLKVQTGEPSGADGFWHHLCVTWDGTQTASSAVKVYWDGVLQSHVADQNGSGTINADSSTTNANGYFLGSEGGSSNFLDSYVSHFYMWNRVISQSERILLRENPWSPWVRTRDRISFELSGAPPLTGAFSAGLGQHAAIAETMHATDAISAGIGLGASFHSGLSGHVVAGLGLGAAFSATLSAIPLHFAAGIGLGAEVQAPVNQTAIISSGFVMGINPGTPTIEGSDQTGVIFSGFVMGINPGVPTAVGGTGGSTSSGGPTGGPTRHGIRVFLCQEDVSKYCMATGVSPPTAGGGGGASGSASQGGGPISITSTALGRAQCTFDLYIDDGSGLFPQVGQTVVINEFSQNRFTGCLKTVTVQPFNMAPGQSDFTRVVFHCLATDKSSICDNRVVIQTYVGGVIATAAINSGGTGYSVGDTFTIQGGDGNAYGQVTAVSSHVVTAFALLNGGSQYDPTTANATTTVNGTGTGLTVNTTIGGQTFQGMVLDIVSKNLNGEGISVAGVDLTSLGVLDQSFIFNYTTVTQAFDQISQATGAQWWVDGQGVLYFVVLPSAPGAPISISSTSDNFRNFAASQTLQNYANEFFAISNLVVIPQSATGVTPGGGTAPVTESYTFVNIGGQPWQQQAYDAGLAPGYVLLKLPIVSIVSVKINGAAVPFYPLSNGFTGLPFTLTYFWFDNAANAAVIFPEFGLPSIGQTIEVGYVPLFSNGTPPDVAPPISPPGGCRCGSGRYQGVIQAPNIVLQSDLAAIASAGQAYYGTIATICNFETNYPGIAVGQQMAVNIPSMGLSSTTIYVTSVTGTCLDGTDLGNGSAFFWVIEASTQKNPGNYLTWYERVVKRTQYPLPLPRYETAQLIAAPGGSLTTGVVSTNPYIVQHTGAAFQVQAAAGTPPIGEDLLIDFLVNGVSILGANKLVIPAGSAVNTVYTSTKFTPPGLYIFAGQVITMSVSYRTLTLSPTAAGSVTAIVQWSF